jgi:hypothetical protein
MATRVPCGSSNGGQSMNRSRLAARWISLIFRGLVIAGPVFAGPPLETDDPDTPGDGQWEINLAATLEKRARLEELTSLLDINYGLGERVQLKVKPRVVLVDGPSTGTRSGVGNIQFGVKWRFVDEDSNGVAMSVYPQIDVNPPGHSVKRGLVSDGAEFFLPLEVARTFGRTRLFGEIGLNWRDHRDDEWVLGVAAEHPLRRELRIVAELRGVAPTRMDDYEFAVRAGLKWIMSKNRTLLGSFGRTLREPREEPRGDFAFLGIQHTF